ncbi:uncharacterized protein DSM5745_00137 [Aspergillus mulundensis]|uniref:F-box domain-containing protein n=1 Tax=Aspergillus mulundensis TaxID=1810919 RepID=A0A3D8T2M2_9EURO|nr:hypothetical protein DSM5745_00137 [Aspergillus mulundensis]RDW92815.1 hypothetical protein DSM5745_00137 [Aspergillus mulundensis]
MASLLSLPTELLLAIFHLLPPLDKHSFSLSCQPLKHTFTPLCPPLSLDNTYALRSRLARDGLRFTSHAYCSACSTMHRHKFFTPSQQSLAPTIRKCTSTQRCLYIGPGIISHDDASKRESWWPRAYHNNHEQPQPQPQRSSGFIVRFGLEHGLRTQEFGLCASYELTTLPDKQEFTVSKAETTRLLRGFDIPTCPHTRLGDGTVARSYRETLSSSRYTVILSEKEEMRRRARAAMGAGNHVSVDIDVDIDMWRSDDSDARCRFPGCKTTFRWEYQSSRRRAGWKTLVLHVKRSLGNLMTPHDPRWMVQLVSVPDEEELAAYVKECFEWRDANMAIEERRYERVLMALGRGRELDAVQECEFEQLRRENDYLRHPHYKHERLQAALEPTAGRGEGVPSTLLLLEARERRQQGVERDLFTPLHSAEAVLGMIEDNTFSKKYNSMRGLGSYQTRIRNLFWGSGDG